MFHLQLDDFSIVGASPELLVKVENNEIEIRPIAGTRRRGVDKDEDLLLADELFIRGVNASFTYSLPIDLGKDKL